jgi:hypothetical protein
MSVMFPSTTTSDAVSELIEIIETHYVNDERSEDERCYKVVLLIATYCRCGLPDLGSSVVPADVKVFAIAVVSLLKTKWHDDHSRSIAAGALIIWANAQLTRHVSGQMATSRFGSDASTVKRS